MYCILQRAELHDLPIRTHLKRFIGIYLQIIECLICRPSRVRNCNTQTSISFEESLHPIAGNAAIIAIAAKDVAGSAATVAALLSPAIGANSDRADVWIVA